MALPPPPPPPPSLLQRCRHSAAASALCYMPCSTIHPGCCLPHMTLHRAFASLLYNQKNYTGFPRAANRCLSEKHEIFFGTMPARVMRRACFLHISYFQLLFFSPWLAISRLFSPLNKSCEAFLRIPRLSGGARVGQIISPATTASGFFRSNLSTV